MNGQLLSDTAFSDVILGLLTERIAMLNRKIDGMLEHPEKIECVLQRLDELTFCRDSLKQAVEAHTKLEVL